MRLSIFGYELIIRRYNPDELKFISEEEYQERERKIDRELQNMRLRT